MAVMLPATELIEIEAEGFLTSEGWIDLSDTVKAAADEVGDKMKFFKLIGPVGRLLGLMPLVRVFTRRQLLDSLKNAGFRIDHQWKPENAMSLFVVATKQG